MLNLVILFVVGLVILAIFLQTFRFLRKLLYTSVFKHPFLLIMLIVGIYYIGITAIPIYLVLLLLTRGSDSRKKIKRIILELLQTRGVVFRWQLPEIYIASCRNDYPYFDSDDPDLDEMEEKALQVSDQYFEELIANNKVAEIELYDGNRAYITKETFDYLKQTCLSLSNQDIIPASQIANLNIISSTYLLNICKGVLPSFPFIAFKDTNDFFVNMKATERFRCSQCGRIKYKMHSNGSGMLCCSSCFEENQLQIKKHEELIANGTIEKKKLEPNQIPENILRRMKKQQ